MKSVLGFSQGTLVRREDYTRGVSGQGGTYSQGGVSLAVRARFWYICVLCEFSEKHKFPRRLYFVNFQDSGLGARRCEGLGEKTGYNCSGQQEGFRLSSQARA